MPSLTHVQKRSSTGFTKENATKVWNLTVEEQRTNLSVAYKEAKRNKCNFCLGVSACFLAVFVVAVVRTSLTYTPIFFLRIAEMESFEVDLSISGVSVDNAPALINYTVIRDYFDQVEDGKYSLNSPRYGAEGIYVWKSSTCAGSSLLDVDIDNTTAIWNYIIESSPIDPIGRTSDPVIQPVSALCSRMGTLSNRFIALDFDKEKRMGCGRRWTLPNPGIVDGRLGLYVQQAVALDLGVQPGDSVVLTLDMYQLFWSGSTITGNITKWERRVLNHQTSIIMQATVVDVYDMPMGKYPDEEVDGILCDYDSFYQLLPISIDPLLPDTVKHNVEHIIGTDYASQTIFNLPAPRLDVYAKSDFDEIKKEVVGFANTILDPLGINVDADLPLVGRLQGLAIFNMFLGLAITLILFVLAVMLALLIYSLLINSVETRTFDLGVMRMIGSTRAGIVRQLIAQTIVFAVPSWAMALILAALASNFLLARLEELTATKIPLGLSSSAVTWSSAMGLLVPLLSTVLPIRHALTQNLNDALDVNRSKTKGNQVTVTRSGNGAVPIQIVVVGSVMTVIGMSLYYMFPQALLQQNFLMLLWIFFGLIIGMLLGLVLLALNLERILERAIVALTLFWNGHSVRSLVLKNLVAHRVRNRKTTIMYSLSLGFIIFVTVTFQLQIVTFRYQLLQTRGSRLKIYISGGSVVSDSCFERMDEWSETEPLVKSITWFSDRVESFDKDISQTRIMNVGKVYSATPRMYAVSPNYLETAAPGFLEIEDDLPSVLELDEQLYTPRGSQSMLMGSVYKDSLALSMNSTLLLELAPREGKYISNNEYHRLRPLAFLNSVPGFRTTQYPLGQQTILVSFPTLLRLMQGRVKSMDELPMRQMYVRLIDGIDDDQIPIVKESLRAAANFCGTTSSSGNWRVWSLDDATRAWIDALLAIDFISMMMTVIAMTVCFFSLSASMYANLHEQIKEIGVLLAIGVRKRKLVRVYVLEAYTLVLSATIMGLLIGTVIGFTMTAQRALFTQLPIPFLFPYRVTFTVFFASIVSAVLSAIIPAQKVVSMPIVRIMRTV